MGAKMYAVLIKKYLSSTACCDCGSESCHLTFFLLLCKSRTSVSSGLRCNDCLSSPSSHIACPYHRGYAYHCDAAMVCRTFHRSLLLTSPMIHCLNPLDDDNNRYQNTNYTPPEGVCIACIMRIIAAHVLVLLGKKMSKLKGYQNCCWWLRHCMTMLDFFLLLHHYGW